MSYDPELRKFIRQEVNNFEQADFAGFIIAISKTHAEFRMTFPKWGVIRINGDEIRFRSKRKYFKSKKAQHMATELSVHILFQMRDIIALCFDFIDRIIDMLQEKFEIEHKPYEDFHPEDYEDI